MFGTKEDIIEYYNANNSDKYKVCVLQCSYKCNIDCKCCYVAKDLKKSDYLMPSDKLEKVVKYCAENDFPMYTGSWEPMSTWEYTRDVLIPLCKKYNAKLIVSTNGLWGNNKKIIQEVVDSNIDMLYLSVDDFHKVDYSSIENILTEFQHHKHTKVFIMTIEGHRVPVPFEGQILVHEFKFGKQYDDKQILFSHDREGNIVYK